MAQKVHDGKTFLRMGLHSFYFKNDQAKLSLQILELMGNLLYFFLYFIYPSTFSCTSFLCKEGSSPGKILRCKN